MNGIRLVTFDVLHTLITPRLPVHVQYSQVFEPYLGTLPLDTIEQSFKRALKTVQVGRPSYNTGTEKWWEEVIRRTALGAGADEQALNRDLSCIVKLLLKRFSSREGYQAYDDAIPAVKKIHDELGIKVAIISNGDSRLRGVLVDLGFPDYLQPIVLSGEEGVEKPNKSIFNRALGLANADGVQQLPIQAKDCLHIGDELLCDYHGAIGSGFKAALLRRRGDDGHGGRKEPGEDLEDIKIIHGLDSVVELCRNDV